MAPKLPRELDEYITKLEKNASTISPPLLVASAFAAGAITTFGMTRIYVRYFKRIKNSDWLTPESFEKKRWIKGVVASVGDADNFRLYHTPGFGWSWPLKFRRIPNGKELKNQTIHIRIAGVDAPEAAHFGRLAQPYSGESLTWLTNRILGQTAYCQVINRDQYSRIVSNVIMKKRFLPGSMFGSSLALEMLRTGWATTYEQAGAEYGRWGKEEYLKTEAGAKILRLGMWEGGLTGESPAEYKRRHAQADSSAPKATKSAKSTARTQSLLSRLKFW